MFEETAALDVAVLLAMVLCVFCAGAWFGWEARGKSHARDHVAPRG